MFDGDKYYKNTRQERIMGSIRGSKIWGEKIK